MIDENFVKQFIVPEKRPQSHFRTEAIAKAAAVNVHAKGQWSDELMNIVRPNEEDQYRDYRKAVFKSPTKKTFAKVENVIAKIGKADDFQIIFQPSVRGIASGEELEKYTTENYPIFDSVENWFFSFALNRMLRDANAVVAVYPEVWPEQDTEYFKPVGKVFMSENVLDYSENEVCVLLDEVKSVVTVGKEQRMEGDILHFFDRDHYQKWVQYGEKSENKYQIDREYIHSFGYLPCFKLGGVIEEFDGSTALYNSFLEPCLDDWDEAARRYSDHQVNMIINLHPDRWEIVTDECKRCKGTGEIREIDEGKAVKHRCKSCNGSGYISNKTPFGVKTINASMEASMNDRIAIPTPPMGNVARDIASIVTLKDEYKSKITEGLSALNMEFLAEGPLAESGISKTMDHDGLNSFLHKVAKHAVENVLKPKFYFISKWRYSFLSEQDIMLIQPKTRIPVTFDIVSSSIASERAAAAKTAGYSHSIVSNLELSYAQKEFGEDSPQYKFCRAMIELDPFAGRLVDEQLALQASGVITKTDFIVSANLSDLIKQAVEADPTFYEKPYSEQKQVITQLATTIETRISEQMNALVEQMLNTTANTPPVNGPGQTA